MPEEITNKNCAELKVLLAIFKRDLEHIKTCVERLASAIEKLNVESFEYKTKMKFVTEDIHELKTYTDNVKAINESILQLKEAFNKIETSFLHHSEIANTNFSNINYDINRLKTQIDNMPLLYVSKTSGKTISDYIKLAPGIIAIITAIVTIFVIYLKGTL